MRTRSSLLLSLSFLFFISVSTHVFGKSCGPDFEQVATKSGTQGEIEKLSGVLSKLIQKEGRVPKRAELAEALKLTQSELKAFFASKHTPRSMPELVQEARELKPEAFEDLQRDLIKKVARFYKNHFRQPTNSELAELIGVSDQHLARIYELEFDAIDLIRRWNPKDFEVLQNKMGRSFARVAKRTGRVPTTGELAAELGLGIREFESLIGESRVFETIDALKEHAQEVQPASFKKVIDTDVFDAFKQEELVKALREKKRFIVTTAVAGAPVNRAFFESLLTYAKKMDAEIVVYPANMVTNELDPILLQTPGVHVLTNSIQLSDRLAFNRIKLLAKQINPLSGLARIGPRGQSQIVGSPKQHMDVVATKNNAENPHKLMSTGALTDPNYAGDLYVSGRTDEIATHDHMMGALVLERNDSMNGSFHLRYIRYVPEREGFMDRDHFFTPNGVSKLGEKDAPSVEALVFGDVHAGDTDPIVWETVTNQIDTFNPRSVVLHDLANFHSISHHESRKVMTRAQRARANELNLDAEFDIIVEKLNDVSDAQSVEEVVIVDANHPRWLVRYLEEGRFMQDPQNTEIGLKLAQALMEGKDPFEYAVKVLKGDQLLNSDKIRFLGRGESYYVGPEHRRVQLGEHGDEGANGGRGSMNSYQKIYDNAVVAHSHSIGIRNGIVNVGTFTYKVLPYSEGGASSWSQGMAVVSSDGQVQLLEFHAGTRTWNSTFDSDIAEDFFAGDFPFIVPNNEPGPGNIDQYSRRAR